MNSLAPSPVRPLKVSQGHHELDSARWLILWGLTAGTAFHLAYSSAAAALLIVVYLFGLVQLAYVSTSRKAFYAGLGVGLVIAVGRLDFFWRIFGPAAMVLWLVYAFWIGLFVLLARLSVRRLPGRYGLWAIPIVWTGLEYFRSELYYLRFSWLTPGLAFGLNPVYAPLSALGVYGVGFVLMSIACAAALAWRTSRPLAALVLVAGMSALGICGWMSQPKAPSQSPGNLSVAGVQLEFPSEKEVLTWLNELIRRHPDAQLLLLSEYTFMGPIPNAIKSWCREHARYLVIGAKDPVSKTAFYDTAFVISPSGEIVFRQAKSVPIQFFNDGLPATEQVLWQSPWGKLGICICYDLSYARVTDRLISLGAQALIVPTMDVNDWGKRQHELHARMGPVRAAEYHIPVVRLASSGISQMVDSRGRVIASAPFPGDGAILAADLRLDQSGRRPVDRWVAPIATALVGLGLVTLALRSVTKSKTRGQKC